MPLPPVPAGHVCSREFALLREYVEADGLTLKDVATVLGVSEGTMSRWCSLTDPRMISAEKALLLTGDRGKEIARCIAQARAEEVERWKIRPEGLPPASSFEALRQRLRGRETEGTFVLSAHNMDYLLEVRAIAGDHEEAVEETLRLPGGSGANTGCALAKLGGTVSFGGVVGDDPDGTDLRRDLEQHCPGSTQTLVTAPGARTGRATILSLRDGTCRAIYVQAGVNARLARALDGQGDRAAALIEAAAQAAGVVHLSSFTGRAEQEMVRGLARRLAPDQVLSFTPHSHVSELGLDSSPELYARVNVLFVYQSHLDLLVRRSRTVRRDLSPIHAVFEWRRSVARTAHEPLVVVVKSSDDDGDELPPGAAKVRATTHQITIYDGGPGEPVGVNPGKPESVARRRMPSVDSTGAGDAMAAAVLSGLWNDLDLATTTDFAQVMALLAGAGTGARETLPDQEEAGRAWGWCYDTTMPPLPRFTRPADESESALLPSRGDRAS